MGSFAGLTQLLRLALAVVTLVGCSINPPLELAQLPAAHSTQLRDVPFYPQTEFECGPAALAGLLGASGVAATPQSLSPQVYLPGRQGSLQIELVAATRRAGRIPYLLDTTPAALVAELGEGRPVLVLQNLRTLHYPVWHYAVLVGLDTGTNQVYLNSASEEGMPIAAPSFLRSWDWAGRWALIALRPGELPVAANAQRYLDAVLSFEALAGGAAAVPAWQAATRRWPREALPYLALGNQAHANEDLQNAAKYYRLGLRADPQHNPNNNPHYTALSNNLASVFGELGCANAGEALLVPVASSEASDSEWAPVMAATLQALALQEGPDGPHCKAFVTLP